MIAVADSSSLIALSICNHLNLLDMFFDKVVVPKAVYNELTLNNKPESEKLRNIYRIKYQKTISVRQETAISNISISIHS
jgi:predicted nucleic acid-binding protein